MILLLLVLNASLLLIYRQVRGTIEKELSERLLSIANATAAGITPAELASPTVAAHLRPALLRIQEEAHLAELYLFDTERRHLLDVDGRMPAGYENPALELHFGAATAALAGVAATSDLYRVGHVYLKTAFAPILDERGEVIAAVGVEGGSDFFSGLWALRRQVLLSGAVGMAAALFLALFFGRLLRAQAVAERTLRETSALAAAGELAAILAHEIRNPLAIISARAERVRAKITRGRSPEEVLEWFDAIPSEVERLNRVLTQYLTFARPSDLEGDAADVSSTLDAALSLLEGDLKRKGIEFDRQDHTGPGTYVRMAPAALHQLLLNLMLNARDAMPEGGRLTVEARTAGPSLILRIADTGCGMSSEQQRRIFESFYTTKERGSGLGLAVVRSMLHLYEGRISVDSAPGKGSAFTLTLRLSRGER